MNGVEDAVARFEADPAILGALSTGEQIAIALVYDRDELLPASYRDRREATARLGEAWLGLVSAYVREHAPTWGNKSEVIEGLRLCRDYNLIQGADRGVDAVYEGCVAAGINVPFSERELQDALCAARMAVRVHARILRKKHTEACACAFCRRFEDLNMAE